jgi:predicted RNA polymerase sigma factor
LLIRRGLSALQRAEQLSAPLGPYTLQAAIAACHARARAPEQTDWTRIVALYDALVELTGSPVVELNRAVAVSMAFGPEAALPLVDALQESGELERYHLLPGVRGELLSRLGRFTEASKEYQRAAEMTANERERAVLLARVKECAEKAT